MRRPVRSALSDQDPRRRGTAGEGETMAELPRIISVDDHVVEPPDLWQSRLPARFRDRGPRIERKKIRFGGDGRGGAGMAGWQDDPDGDWCDVWYYDDLVSPFMMLSAAVGFD